MRSGRPYTFRNWKVAWALVKLGTELPHPSRHRRNSADMLRCDWLRQAGDTFNYLALNVQDGEWQLNEDGLQVSGRYVARVLEAASAHLDRVLARYNRRYRPAPLNLQPAEPSQSAPTHPWKVCNRQISGPRRRQTLREMLGDSAGRPAPSATVRSLPGASRLHIDRLGLLKRDFPNFSEPLDVIEDHLHLLCLADEPLCLPPLLLVGEPGVGKTAFARQLSHTLGFQLEVVGMAETTAGWSRTGADPSWKSASAGRVAKLMLECPDRMAPLLMLDEIDKAIRGTYPVDNALLGLLEPGTAAMFRDEFYKTEFDARPLSILATSNSRLPKSSPLNSRLMTLEINLPTSAQMPALVRSIERSVREDRPGLARRIAPLSDDLICCSPSEVNAKSSAIWSSRLAEQPAGPSARQTPGATNRSRYCPTTSPPNPRQAPRRRAQPRGEYQARRSSGFSKTITAAVDLTRSQRVPHMNTNDSNRSVRIRYLSDLHMEFTSYVPSRLPSVDEDVVVLAGDIGIGMDGIDWAREAFPDVPVIYVPGNHEYYRQEMKSLRSAYAADHGNVVVLDGLSGRGSIAGSCCESIVQEIRTGQGDRLCLAAMAGADALCRRWPSGDRQQRRRTRPALRGTGAQELSIRRSGFRRRASGEHLQPDRNRTAQRPESRPLPTRRDQSHR